MKGSEWQIGLFGTFDVENYGDLLFPLIAEAELSKRLGPTKLHRFSYHAKTPPDWPYPVTSLTELPQMVSSLDGILIGGGFIIRFDKEVALGYESPSTAIHHPTGYWLTPTLIGLQHNIPVAWNTPGMDRNEIPAWADPLMKLALPLCRYIAVRDEPSRAALTHFIDKDQIALVPDTAFGIASLFDERVTIEFNQLREASGLTGPYIIIQATLGLDAFLHFVKNHADRLRDFRFLALPIGPVLCDHERNLGDDLPGLICLPSWPHPLLLAKLISQAEAVIGHSYHLSVTALATGVPAFNMQNLTTGKYSPLSAFDKIYQLAKDSEPDLDWFLARVGRTSPSKTALSTLNQLAQHWDNIATVLLSGPTNTQPPLNRFWQSLPGLLEDGANRRAASVEVLESEMINLKQIARHSLETEPYKWAEIDNLFSHKDAAALAATFPCDHYKLVMGYGGEKDYEYEARALIGMGADNISYPEDLSEAWRNLAHDLLSPDYRTAMSLLTGCDLTKAQLEVNVFHYGQKALLGPHPDLPEKIVTHVLYFNQSWNKEDGGYLTILRSADPTDIIAEIMPIVGTSAVLVRSKNSWHTVTRVVNDCPVSRRSLTATFYRPGSVSTMWPPGDVAPLHSYNASELKIEAKGKINLWARWLGRFRS
jgi:hypothetical protein